MLRRDPRCRLAVPPKTGSVGGMPRRSFASRASSRRGADTAGRSLLVVDNRPLQQAAWKKLGAARRRLAKATADLHRHENVDEPGFRAWTASVLPSLLTELRELAAQFSEKEHQVVSVEDEAAYSGRRPERIWQARKNPPRADAPSPRSVPGRWEENDEAAGPSAPGPFDRAAYDEFMEQFFAEHGISPEDTEADKMRRDIGGFLGFGPTTPASYEDPAREIYRRLVQQLHPDRGGEWTPDRAGLWHEVQQAWAAHDLDWLSRLEVEWEAAAERLGPTSPLGRLQQALREIDGARRDADRRLRVYRQSPAWRFSLLPAPGETLRRRVEEELRHEIFDLRAALAEIERTIADWERAVRPRGARQRRRSAPYPTATGSEPEYF